MFPEEKNLPEKIYPTNQFQQAFGIIRGEYVERIHIIRIYFLQLWIWYYNLHR